MPTDYYADDLTADDSLITLQEADAILATTLHGREWTARADADRAACTDDTDQTPDRVADKAALIDASAILSTQPWNGRPVSGSQPQAFPRHGLTYDDGKVVTGVPAAVRRATAILAAILSTRADQSMSPETFRAYQIGEVRGEFRAPIRDDLPRPVRQLLNPFLRCGSSWSQVKP